MKENDAIAATVDQGRSLELLPDLSYLLDKMVNLYFVGHKASKKWTLVDAGLYGSAHRIRKAAEERFGEGARPEAIILTHGHFDHVGAAAALADEWDVPIYAHRLEFPYLTGRSAYPPPDPSVSGAMARMSWLYPRRPIDLGSRLHELPAEGTLPGMPGWRWIPTPGHAPGHISLFRDADRTLIAGDAFVTTNQASLFAVMTQLPVLQGPPAYFTPDWKSARRSVERLAALRPEIAATGHGHPMQGESMRNKLDKLVRDFDRLAIPTNGRYAGHPALADESGVVYVPPATIAGQIPKIITLATLAVVGGVLLGRTIRNSKAA